MLLAAAPSAHFFDGARILGEDILWGQLDVDQRRLNMGMPHQTCSAGKLTPARPYRCQRYGGTDEG